MLFASSACMGLCLILVCGTAVHGQQLSRKVLEEQYNLSSFRAVSRDSFPVLYNPPMGTVKDGDRILESGEWVIGIERGNEAKAYPIDVMGFHELINDTVGGEPIAVCW